MRVPWVLQSGTGHHERGAEHSDLSMCSVARSCRSPASPASPAQGASDDDAAIGTLDRLIETVKSSGVLNLGEDELQAGLDMWHSRRFSGEKSTENTLSTGVASGGGGGGASTRGAVSSSENINAVGMTYQQYQALMEVSAFLGCTASCRGARTRSSGTTPMRWSLVESRGLPGRWLAHEDRPR